MTHSMANLILQGKKFQQPCFLFCSAPKIIIDGFNQKRFILADQIRKSFKAFQTFLNARRIFPESQLLCLKKM